MRRVSDGSRRGPNSLILIVNNNTSWHLLTSRLHEMATESANDRYLQQKINLQPAGRPLLTLEAHFVTTVEGFFSLYESPAYFIWDDLRVLTPAHDNTDNFQFTVQLNVSVFRKKMLF